MSTTGADLEGDIHMLATIKYLPSTLPLVLPYVRAIQEESSTDPNCVRYEILVYPPTDSLVVVESYKSKAAIDAHIAGPAHTKYWEECEKYIVEKDWKFYSKYS
ncbi:hypothetical protein CALCODRAFT_555899 [Calocera cornea HHB12733]|uniref:ABM domain-containing protein n=1 Tax=Calocera cornea HHB12733 TaxID=1353952 RepID=A0A165FA89_9BASI|nr:hypothetical protein CALCODRAFT_555899 [Calocera cornea HHB12733]